MPHCLLDLLLSQQMGQGLDDHFVAAIAQFIEDLPSKFRRHLMVVEEVPRCVHLDHRLRFVLSKDGVELMFDVRGRDFLCHIVHVAAHGAPACARPIATPRPEDDHPGIDDLAVEQILLGPGGNVLSRVELPRSPFIFHELLEPHERASNTPTRKNLLEPQWR